MEDEKWKVGDAGALCFFHFPSSIHHSSFPVSSPVPAILSWSRRHRRVVVIATLCLAAAAAAGMRGLRFDTDVLALLPRGGQRVPAFRTFVHAFGSVDDLYVVFTAPAGRQIREYADEIDTWSERLRRVPGVARVDTGLVDQSRDLTWFADRRLLLLGGGNLESALDRFHGETLRESLRRRRALLTVPSPAILEVVRYDPLGLFDLVRAELGASQAGANLGVTEGGYVSADGVNRLVVAKPSQAPFDSEFSRALMGSLEALRAELSRKGERASDPANAGDERPLMLVRFAGGHRIAVETAAVIKRESILNTAGSLALILPLLFIVFRSTWLVLVGPLPSAISLVLVLGLLGLAGTTLSAAATASSAMLFGLGVDGVVLLYVAYTHAVRMGSDPSAAIDGLGGPASSMLLGMWTTAATFYGLTFVDFPSLEQLGALIGHSMLLCGVLTLVLVPVLLPLRPPARAARALAMPAFAAWVDRHSRAIVVATVVLTVAMGAAATRLRVNPTLERLRAVTPGATLLQEIGPLFGLPDDVYVVLTSGPDLDALLAENERLRAALAAALPDTVVQAPSSLLPSESTQRERQTRIQSVLESPELVASALSAAEREEGFRSGSFDPFRERLPHIVEDGLRLTYDGYVSHGLEDLIGRFIARRGDGWLLATYAFPNGAEAAAGLERAVASVDSSAVVTGLPLVNRELAARFLPEFVKGLSIGTIVVVALVVIALRDVRLTILSLVPTAIGLVWAAGLLATGGATLDLFALFAVVTFVGIGVDYGVHVVHRYQERADAVQAVAELAPVILVAGLITLLGYGTLMASSYPPLQSIGVVSAVSVGALAAASLFVLPAILSSLERSRRR